MKENKQKIASKIVICILILGIICTIPKSHAESIEASITKNSVNLRSGPGTNNSIIATVNQGTQVILKSTEIINGSGCDTGWYNISYDNKNAYVCASYLNVPGIGIIDSLGRPWTSPKKAIYGGAKFISSGYIANGQNTSYLKKFNVNPNSAYSVYKHQYMANLQAPSSEASTSYKTYLNNDLLSLPLTFVIPIFNNMPEYTTHSKNGQKQGGTSEVKDEAFEDYLNQQGFDETYKKWLRSLHEIHPNWTFQSLKTGLDFTISVEEEKWVSSIQKTSCSQCIDASNTNTEGNWYIANTETTAYYLDPRNFLEESTILMFEDLGYNENYTQASVESVLKGTFMEGTDPIDNLPYANIFWSAGKDNNVSPIYLASLSRQEVGTQISMVTSGAQFEYKGYTYVGFYNFFNIGAYSSEENPAKAGLVYASSGAVQNVDGIFTGGISVEIPANPSNNNQNEPTPMSTHISRMDLVLDGNYIKNVALNTTVATLKQKTNASEVTFKTEDGTLLGDTEKIRTGTILTSSTNESYQIVIYGDLTGDGNINSADLLQMRKHLLEQINLTGVYLEAARLANKEGNINSADLLKLRQYLLGQSGISQI